MDSNNDNKTNNYINTNKNIKKKVTRNISFRQSHITLLDCSSGRYYGLAGHTHFGRGDRAVEVQEIERPFVDVDPVDFEFLGCLDSQRRLGSPTHPVHFGLYFWERGNVGKIYASRNLYIYIYVYIYF